MITTNSLVLFTVRTLVFMLHDYYAFISTFYCTNIWLTIYYVNTVQVLFTGLLWIKTSHSHDCRFSYWRRHLQNWIIMLSSRWVYQSLPLWCTSLCLLDVDSLVWCLNKLLFTDWVVLLNQWGLRRIKIPTIFSFSFNPQPAERSPPFLMYHSVP